MMNLDIDIEMKLLAGKPIKVDNVTIEPLTLAEITEHGFMKYNYHLGILCVDVDEVKKDLKIEDEITAYDFLILNCMSDESNKRMIEEAFECFIKKPVSFDERGFFFIGNLEDEEVIYADNFEQIKWVLKVQNNVQEKPKEPEYNPANETARKLIEKIKRNKANAPKVKEDISLTSIISGVAWKSHIGIKTVWDLTIYQLYDAFYRLEIVDNYDKTLTGVYAGTIDGKGIDIKKINWIKTINNG